MAAGGGAFESENGAKVHLPGANLNDIANQADDLLEVHIFISNPHGHNNSLFSENKILISKWLFSPLN